MTDPLAEKIGINVQGGTVNVQNLNIGIAERLAQVGDRVRILVVAANPLGSSPLKLDHEVKTIQEALTRSRKRDNFVVEYRLAATPSELRRALLDVEPHILHFSGHGAGEQGLLFVSDESAGAIYRSTVARCDRVPLILMRLNLFLLNHLRICCSFVKSIWNVWC